MANGSDPASGTAGPGSVGQVSARQRLIELEGTARETVEVRRPVPVLLTGLRTIDVGRLGVASARHAKSPNSQTNRSWIAGLFEDITEARVMPHQVPPPVPSDEELNTYIRTRYALLGIDVSVLPVSDSDAPMDLERLLANARSILRQDAEAADFEIDPQFNLPMPFPAPFTAWTRE